MTNPQVLVTGGGGFLGHALCRQLVEAGYKVRSFSRKAYPALATLGVEHIQGTLHDAVAVEEALQGCEGVFHCAGNVDVWGKWNELYAANVKSTEVLLAAMERAGIPHLVFTSSPSVVSSRRSIENGDESLPYPAEYLAHYPATKALAERLVLAADGKQGLRTVALRPHLIWGPGDPNFAPKLVEARQAGRLRRIGSGTNLVDVIYVDNAATAHIQAFETLRSTPDRVGGKTYFIGQERPVSLWDFVDNLLVAYGEAPLMRRALPAPLAYAMGWGCEIIFGALRIYHRLPPMTRFIAIQMTRSHYFQHRRAEQDFGYSPRVSLEQGLRSIAEATS